MINRNSVLVLGIAGSLVACSSLPSLNPMDWFSGSSKKKMAELVPISSPVPVRIQWRASTASSGDFVFTPQADADSVYATGRDGRISRFNGQTGNSLWRVAAGQSISGGVGAGDNIVVVGTPKGDVIALDGSGKTLWKEKTTSEVLSAPQILGDTVIVRSADARVVGLDAATGKRKWNYQRPTPALSLRSFAGVTVARGLIFVGFSGGKLVALNPSTGALRWEATVSAPKGTSELERVTDVVAAPVLDGNSVCAVAFQGRLACFDASSGNTLWAREISSVAGLTIDNRQVYVSDDKGNVQAFDRANGTSVWKLDKLTGRGLSAPVALGNYIAVADIKGFVHVLSRNDGGLVGRVALDGSAVTAKPQSLDRAALFQTRDGGVFVVSAD